MAEAHRLKRAKKIEIGQIEPESRRQLRPKMQVLEGGRSFDREQQKNIQTLDRLMSEYEVMPDSFIMPEMYQKFTLEGGERVFTELEKAKRNKLITGWFAKMFQALETICRQYDFDQTEIEKLNIEFKQLIGEEDEAAMKLIHQSLGDKRVEQISPEELPCIIKEGKKGVASDFLARKMSVIERLEKFASGIKAKLLALIK